MSGSEGKSTFMKSIYGLGLLALVLQSDRENSRTPEIFWECYCFAREKPIRCEKTKPQARMSISLWFHGQFKCLDLCFVIGHNTITIPEIFQVFTVFPVAL